MEYSNDACVADLLDLDMHCRRKAGKWRYSEDSEEVRRIMRQLHNKLISNTHIDRDRTYSSNNKMPSRSQRNSMSHGKSSTHTTTRNRLACYKWNGRDKNGMWTAVSHCDKTDETCTYNHMCSHCFGAHQRFSKDGCKATEHDNKHDSK